MLMLLLDAPYCMAVERQALIVGNGNYSAIGRLKNASSDAQLMADTLRSLNFQVSLLLDASQEEMKQQIAKFGRDLRGASKDAVGFFFYAGHGIQASGRNYLLPVEASPADQADLDLMGVEANWVLRQMESAGNRTNIIVLDACRNNPFTTANRSLGRGLAQIDAPTGSFISYSTAPGKVALDGDQVNSPYTSALAKALQIPGIGIEQVFKKVRREVISITGGEQTPWDSSSLVDDFYAKPDPGSDESSKLSDALKLWRKVRTSEDSNRVALFLSAYPNSEFVPEASQLLTRLLASKNKLAGPELIAIPESMGETRKSGTARSETRTSQDRRAFSQALETKTLEQYQRYLSRYPDGIFVSIAKRKVLELGSLNTSDAGNRRYFDQPWFGEKHNPEMLSLKQLVDSLPLYPPYNGLAVMEWATVSCSQCHHWTKELLCRQGKYYAKAEESAMTRIKHPYGGFLKRGVKAWAEQGCL